MPKDERVKRLREFLMESFEVQDLYMFLDENGYSEVAEGVSQSADHRGYCFKVARAFYHQGLIDDALFECLTKARPRKRTTIEELHQYCMSPEPIETLDEVRTECFAEGGGQIVVAKKEQAEVRTERFAEGGGRVPGFGDTESRDAAAAVGLTPDKFEVESIPDGGEDPLAVTEDFRIVLARACDTARPSVLLAVTRGWRGDEGPSFNKVMRKVKDRLGKDNETIEHVVVFCGNWEPDEFKEYHRKDLEAHAARGVRFSFVKMRVASRPPGPHAP